ncbi:MAG: hypothetical protein Ta2A_17730 [Treponemataceae bacterium]|nr:MAG: hypothetical protein Ta2A_17730 [Treponemataceae bacterium]
MDITKVLEQWDPQYIKNGGKQLISEMFNTDAQYPFSEKLFRYFGAEIIDSLDYSNYEGASIIQDMNQKVTETLKNKYSLVWDGGALEHIFNFPTAIRNCMEMAAIGGHLILETPANNHLGHGFYQFSPELFFSILNEKNGFTNTRVFLVDDKHLCYETIAPQKLKKRVETFPVGGGGIFICHIAKNQKYTR